MTNKCNSCLSERRFAQWSLLLKSKMAVSRLTISGCCRWKGSCWIYTYLYMACCWYLCLYVECCLLCVVTNHSVSVVANVNRDAKWQLITLYARYIFLTWTSYSVSNKNRKILIHIINTVWPFYSRLMNDIYEIFSQCNPDHWLGRHKSHTGLGVRIQPELPGPNPSLSQTQTISCPPHVGITSHQPLLCMASHSAALVFTASATGQCTSLCWHSWLMRHCKHDGTFVTHLSECKRLMLTQCSLRIIHLMILCYSLY